MPAHKTPNSASEILRELHEFLLEPDADASTMPIEEVRAKLREDGIDAKSHLKQLKDRVAKARSEEQLARARSKRQILEERWNKYRAQAKEITSSTREQIIRQIENLSLRQPETAMAYFRKLEEASDADLQTLLDDIEFLDSVEEEKGDDEAK